jgi:hypothetical protein
MRTTHGGVFSELPDLREPAPLSGSAHVLRAAQRTAARGAPAAQRQRARHGSAVLDPFHSPAIRFDISKQIIGPEPPTLVVDHRNWLSASDFV